MNVNGARKVQHDVEPAEAGPGHAVTALDQRVFRVHDVKIHALQVQDVTSIVEQWFKDDQRFRYVSSTNVNNVAIALESPQYYDAIENAAMSLPDGVPFLWLGRLKGFMLRKRCGIEEFMEAMFETSHHGTSYSHFFYGNTPEVLGRLETTLLNRYPRLDIAGMHSPPFRELTSDELADDIRMINESGADFLWVSLGCPKQEQWLYDNRESLSVRVGGGAGAVFNFLSGDARRAPAWVRYAGLEWVLRLMMEPRRLFSRYCIRYPKFVFGLAMRSLLGS